MNCIAHHVRRCNDEFLTENADIIVNSTRLTAAQFGCDVSYMGKRLVTNPDMIKSWDDLRVPPSARRPTTVPPVVTKPPVIDPNYQSTTTYYYIYEGNEDDGQFDHIYSDKNDGVHEGTKEKFHHDKPPDNSHEISISREEINRDYSDTYNVHQDDLIRNHNSDRDTESDNRHNSHSRHNSHTDNGIKERDSAGGDTSEVIENNIQNQEISLKDDTEEDTNMLESRDHQKPIQSRPASSGKFGLQCFRTKQKHVLSFIG